jgi:hypothetical protein
MWRHRLKSASLLAQSPRLDEAVRSFETICAGAHVQPCRAEEFHRIPRIRKLNKNSSSTYSMLHTATETRNLARKFPNVYSSLRSFGTTQSGMAEKELKENNEYAPSEEDESMLSLLMDYRERHGNCHVPSGSSQLGQEEREQMGVSEELSNWLDKTRNRYRRTQGTATGKVNKSFQVLIVVLESMGFMWSEREAQWLRMYNRLQAHAKVNNGSTEVDKEKDKQLATWIDVQRKAYKKCKLSEERKEFLDELDFVFEPHEARWFESYDKLCQYKEEHNDVLVPAECENDPNLGAWVSRQRVLYNAGQLSDNRLKALEKVGFVWDPNRETWDRFYAQLCEFHAKHGHTRIARSEGALWMWADRQRSRLKRSRQKRAGEINELDSDDLQLSALTNVGFYSNEDDEVTFERAKQLRDITFQVDPHEEAWWENVEKIHLFKKKFGHLAVPFRFVDDQGLSDWVRRQRVLYGRDKLSPERVETLADMGFGWTARDARWNWMYDALCDFKMNNGHTRVPGAHSELHRWVAKQRRIFAPIMESPELSGSLDSSDAERISKLQKLLLWSEDDEKV